MYFLKAYSLWLHEILGNHTRITHWNCTNLSDCTATGTVGTSLMEEWELRFILEENDRAVVWIPSRLEQ